MKHCSLFLLAAHAAMAADSTLPDFLPPGIKVMFGVQVGRIAASPRAQGFTPDAGALNLTGEWQKAVSLIGLDSIKDIEEVLIVATGTGAADGNPPMLLIAHGKFGNLNFGRFAAQSNPYQGVPVFEAGAGSTGAVAMLDASTVILGELREVRAAIDRRGSAPDAALEAAVASLRGSYDIWGLGDKPASLIPATDKPGLDSGIDSIDHFQFGISLSHGLEVAGEVRVSAGQDAEKLMTSVRFIEMMMKAQQPAASATKFDISAKDGTIKLALAIPEEEFNKMIETQRAAWKEKLKQIMPGVSGIPMSAQLSAPISAPVEAAPVKPQAARTAPTAGGTLTGGTATGGTAVFTLPGNGRAREPR